MTTSTTSNQNIESTTLRNRIEQSVALLCERDDAKTQPPTGSSDRHSLPIHIDTAYLQKGALVDAAKALAALWKVPSRGKLPNRAMQYSR